MIRRRPIARMAVRTTVVAGTAVAAGAVVGAAVGSRNARAAAPAPAAVAPAPAPAPEQYVVQQAPPDTIEQLTQLAALRDSGALTEAEFVSQKSLLLPI